MSRITELKKQYPELNISMFDLIERIDVTKTYKYVPLLCKLFASRWGFENSESKISDEFINDMKQRLRVKGIDISDEKSPVIHALTIITDNYPDELFQTTKEFIDRMEQNKIKNKDLSTYSSLDSLRSAISLSNLKDIEKELESQIIKEYEDDTWLILKPLTFESSAKYGSGTRWCTTYQDKSYFMRYWRRGILVYFINKQNGYKFAGFKSLDSENELSFWDPSDQRLDYLQLEIEDYLFPIVRKIFNSTETNRDLCTLGMIGSVENYSDQFFKVSEDLFPNDNDHLTVNQGDQLGTLTNGVVLTGTGTATSIGNIVSTNGGVLTTTTSGNVISIANSFTPTAS